MSSDHPPRDVPHLAWVYPECPMNKLDAATWLETTRELRKLGWRVTLIAAGPASKRCIRGVEVLCIPKPQVYLLRQVAFHIRLLRLLSIEWTTIDVILFHPMSALWLLPLRLVRRLSARQRPRLVMDNRTVPMPVSTRKERLRASFHGLMNRLANRWADGQTAITQRMAQTVGIPSQQLLGIWSSGVSLDLFAPAQMARRWPLPGEPIHLVYVGALCKERNLLSLCEAVEKANSEGMAFVLSLIGEGAERLGLEEFALRTEGRVRVLKPVPYDRVPRLLAQAHVGVLPFPDEEKFRVSSPIKLFEYVAAGLPVLATRIACHTDVVNSGNYAFWAEDASVEGLLAALRLIWKAQASLASMGREAGTAGQAWTWQESARKLARALERALLKDADD